MSGLDDPVSLDLPRGLMYRPATSADGRAIYELIATCEEEADGVAEVDEDDLTVAFGRQGFDPAQDSVLVTDGDLLVAWADLYRSRSEGDVRPSHRGRGIGSNLLRWIEMRGRAHGDTEARQTKSDANSSARDLFLSKGYEASFVSWMIRIELDGAPETPIVPDGISIRPYTAADATDVHSVIDAAFSEWEGREPESYEVWASQAIAQPAFVPEISPLAFEGDELVGVVLAADYPAHNEGWIMQLATRASHRRRGIAQALLLTAFGWFQERGRTIAGVSTDSRTGALGLYERVGMRVQRQYTRYVKPLP